MRTKPVDSDAALAALRRLVDGAGGVRIDGAEGYWLGGLDGMPLGPESGRTREPFAQALAHVRAGTHPDDLVVWSRLAGGERYRVAGGDALVALAERSAGIPARPRVAKE